MAILFALGSASSARAFDFPPKCYPGAPCNTDPTPVPEPGSFAQMAAGLFAVAGLGLIARKRQAAKELQ
jgi:MYXO-CTERM domain-containing protein